MVPVDYLLAVALVMAPVGSPEPTAPDAFAALGPAVKALALRLELLDPREARYILTRPQDFGSDLTLLRQRYRELADAPPLADGQRFPDRAAINDMLAFNQIYRQNLENRLAVETVRARELQEAIQETDRLYFLWNLVRDARCDYYDVTVRRQALKRLRDLAGEEAYSSGHLPPYVPLWRFQTINGTRDIQTLCCLETSHERRRTTSTDRRGPDWHHAPSDQGGGSAPRPGRTSGQPSRRQTPVVGGRLRIERTPCPRQEFGPVDGAASEPRQALISCSGHRWGGSRVSRTRCHQSRPDCRRTSRVRPRTSPGLPSVEMG